MPQASRDAHQQHTRRLTRPQETPEGGGSVNKAPLPIPRTPRPANSVSTAFFQHQQKHQPPNLQHQKHTPVGCN